MNKSFLIGRLTKDPEVRTTGSGISVASFTIAVDRRFKNKDGETETDFIPIVTWRGLADNCGKYLSRGSKVAIIGTIITRNYEDSNGVRRYVTEIQADEVEFLTPKSGANQSQAQQAPPPEPPPEEQMGLSDFEPLDDGEGLPF